MAGKLLYNSRIYKTYLRLLKQRYPHVDIAELLEHAEMEPCQVEDEGHWFTQKQVNSFHEKLVGLTGNQDIAKEAGAYTASPEVLGGIRRYMLGLVSPARAYGMVSKFSNKFTRSSRYESRKLGNNKIEFTVTPYEGVEEAFFQCKNRLGYLEAMARMFDYKAPRVEHPECLFRNGKVCRYIVSWQDSPIYRWQKIRNFIGVPLLLLSLFVLFETIPFFVKTAVVLGAVATLFLFNWLIVGFKARELERAVKSLQESSDELIEQTNINYKNSLLISEIGQALSKQLELGGQLDNLTRALQKRLDYDRGLILMANQDRSKLVFQTGYGYTEKQLKLLEGTSFHLDIPESRGVFVVAFKDQRPFLLNDIDELKDQLSAKSYEFALKMGARSFICCPIVYEGGSLGIMAVDNIETKKPLLERDKNLLMGVANQIAISIHNAKLLADRLRQFESILQVLVASTDARDPITGGHSIKVTEYVVGICREMGLDPEYTDMVRVAALLHDYGKIGVEDEILKKPGRLSPEQYAIIKTHVDKSRSILGKIEFEGVYKKVPEIVGAHHEKLDGTGYPKGLKNNEIPLGAKIIAVADVFEALTSRKQYREPITPEKALDKMVKKIGVYYDQACLEALIRYYNDCEADMPYTRIQGSQTT
ncbi:MAG: HD domain-containing phosphohydrolase [Thermodesulfobacteriota bacterium]